jgi:phosphoribosylanthranilate isomerase
MKKKILVKICGITNLEDARFCCAAGADILGFVFAKSPRRVTAARAQRIIAGLPEKIVTAGIFVNEKPAKIERIAARCGLDMIQLHGDESARECDALMKAGYPVIKALRIQDKDSFDAIQKYPGVDWILLDRFQKGAYGGTGKVIDWPLVKQAKKYRKKLMLSGGLGCDNIAEALRAARPDAVDASSRLEKIPGKKDHALLQVFIQRAKGSVKGPQSKVRNKKQR